MAAKFLARRRRGIAIRHAQQTGRWRVGMLDTVPASRMPRTLRRSRPPCARSATSREPRHRHRSPEGRPERLPGLATELIGLKCDVILARGTPAALAAKNATSTIAIVMTAVAEPIEAGLVQSLARPGGNVTGMSAFVTQLAQKRIELLKELEPRISRIGFMANMSNASVPAQWDEIKLAAQALGVGALMFDVRKPEDVPPSFDAAVAKRIDAFAVGNDSVLVANHQRVTALAAQHRLPTIYASREYVDAGGLISYAANYPDLYRRVASYVDKIFKGAKPADLPVQQPTQLEIVSKLKVARALGLTVPLSLLGRADEVIE